jgi:hypothetical protein
MQEMQEKQDAVVSGDGPRVVSITADTSRLEYRPKSEAPVIQMTEPLRDASTRYNAMNRHDRRAFDARAKKLMKQAKR